MEANTPGPGQHEELPHHTEGLEPEMTRPIGVDFGVVFGGVRGWIDRNDDRSIIPDEDDPADVARLKADALALRNAGEFSLATRDPKPEYDPLAKWDKKHRTTRTGFGFTSDKEDPPREPIDRSAVARTPLQAQRERTNGYRVDHANKLDSRVKKFTDLYGDILHDKDALETTLKDGRYTRGERRGIRAAARRARADTRSQQRVIKRATAAAKGKDVAGTVVGLRIKAKTESNASPQRKIRDKTGVRERFAERRAERKDAMQSIRERDARNKERERLKKLPPPPTSP